MNKRNPIYRTCIVAHKKLLKSDLFRVVRNENGIYFDNYQNIPGRGVYISKSLDIIMTAQKKNSLSRGLRCDVPDEIYIELIQALNQVERK